ncbi:MAG TPA: gliding motility-associated C-terminal domain-containing protein [Saprospiraceae bacterium]|nr:gliding motility-associated C-terminal domain-containing protein [Saprospiraceae bacterium]
MRFTIKYIILLLLLAGNTVTKSQICDPLVSSIAIQDSQVTMVQIIVEGVFPEDLSSEAQCLSAIRLHFGHNQIGDLTMRLVSPAGQEVTLAGPYTNSNNTSFADWDITFTSCGNLAAPDNGFPDTWSNSAPWAILGNYSGVYYPYDGCLEDFNTGSVNGTWTLIIEDHLDFDDGMIHSVQLFFCDAGSIDCNLCEVDAGDFPSDTLTYCRRSPQLYFNQLESLLTGTTGSDDYDLIFVVSKKDTLIGVDTLLDLRFYEADTFNICAIRYHQNDSLLLDSIHFSNLTSDYLSLFSFPAPQYCADISDTCLHVIVLPSPELDDIVFDEINCYHPEVTISAIYETGPLILEWEYPNSDLYYGDELITDQPGEHYLRVWNTYGCSWDTSIVVTSDLEEPNFILPDSFPLSCIYPLINMPIVLLEPFDSIHWSGPSGFSSNVPQPQTNLPGVYEVIIWGTNGCISHEEILITESDELTEFTIQIDTLTCDHNPGSIFVDFTGAFVVTWTNLQTSSVSSGPLVTYTASDTFLMSIRDQSSNCKAERIITGVLDTLTPTIIFNPPDSLNCFITNVSLSFDDPDQYQYFEWSGDGKISQEPTFEVGNPGWYFLEVQGSNGCFHTDSIEVIENLDYHFEDLVIFLDCSEDSIRLGIPFLIADHHEWLKDGQFFSYEINPFVHEGGFYQLVAGTESGCVDTIRVDIFEDRTKPLISLSVQGEINCLNHMARIEADIISIIQPGAFWTGPDGFYSESNPVMVSEPGIYIFHATGTNDCIFQDSVELTSDMEFPQVQVFGDSIFCNEPVRPLNIHAIATGEIENQFWQGPGGFYSTTLSNIVTEAGMYILTIEGSNGCTTSDTAFVVIDTLLPQLILSPIDTINCYNNGVFLSVHSNQTLSEIQWSGPLNFKSDQSTIFVDQPGFYIVKIYTPSGCFNEEHFSIPINKLRPYLSLNAPTVTCRDTVVMLEHLTNADLYSLYWTGPDDFYDFSHFPLASDPGWYFCQITDLNNGCVHQDSILLKADFTQPTMVTQDFNLPCSGKPIEIFVNSSPEQADHFWQGPGNFIHHGDTALVDLPGTYYITVVNPMNGCSLMDSVQVSSEPVYPEFEVFHENINCRNKIIKPVFISHSDISTVEWTGPDGFYSQDFAPELNLEGLYQLSVTGENGCIKDTILKVLTDTIPPEISILYDDFLTCEKNTSILNASGSESGSHISYFWQTNDGVILNGHFSQFPKILGPGWYVLTLVNLKNHCMNVDSVLVQEMESDLDSISVQLFSPSCFGQTNGSLVITDVFGGQPPVRYAIGNNYFSPINYFDHLAAGTYTIRVKDAYGCTYDTTIVMQHGSDIQLQLYADKNNIYPGEQVRLTAGISASNEIDVIQWLPIDFIFVSGVFEQLVAPLETTTFSLYVKDTQGCDAESSITVLVKEKPDIYIPNIFSPNGDQINDRFFVQGKPDIGNVALMEVFDRWGNRVFYSENLLLNDYATAWDGSFNGSRVTQGVYTYHIIMKSASNKLTHFTGDITVIW